jgi:large subunit ribosomal protein L13
MEAKQYITHSLYPGGQKVLSPRQMMEKSSTRIIEHAVRGMLPKNRLGSKLFTNLFVYEGAEHPHAAQQPKQVSLTHL